MSGLLPSFKVLAESQGCPRQIVKFMNMVYGFQCHLEFTKQSVAELTESVFELQHVDIKKQSILEGTYGVICIRNWW